MRLIHYADPETGSCYQFLTTDMELAPGLIAWLYLLRWRIEKLFDTAKNKFQETKAWAAGRIARQVQAHFLALTHNLLVLFRGLLQNEFGLREEKPVRKREDGLRRRGERASEKNRVIHPLHFQMTKIVQLTVQFIRTLRNQILAKASLREALPWIRQRFLA